MDKKYLCVVVALVWVHCHLGTTLADSDGQVRDPMRCHGSDQGNYWPAIEAYLQGHPQAQWTRADCKLLAPVWTGDDAKGQLFTPLWNGVGAAIEDWVAPPPSGNCDGLKGTVRIDWDQAQNTVQYTIKGINLTPRQRQDLLAFLRSL